MTALHCESGKTQFLSAPATVSSCMCFHPDHWDISPVRPAQCGPQTQTLDITSCDVGTSQSGSPDCHAGVAGKVV